MKIVSGRGRAALSLGLSVVFLMGSVVGCTSTSRQGRPSVNRRPGPAQMLDEWTYRVAQAGSVADRPTKFAFVVERSPSCTRDVTIDKTYTVRRETKYPEFWMWMVLVGGAGAGAGAAASKGFDEDSFLGESLYMAMIGAAAGVALATLLPTGKRFSTAKETESETLAGQRENACSPYSGAGGAQVKVRLASGAAVESKADGSGRVELDVPPRVWKAAIDVGKLADVSLPGGQSATIELTEELRTLAIRMWDRAKRQQKPPVLDLVASFEDPAGDGDGVLDAGETGALVLKIVNTGGGTAYAVRARHEVIGSAGRHVEMADATLFGEIGPGAWKVERVQLKAGEALPSGEVRVAVAVDEEMGFGLGAPAEIRFKSDQLAGPELRLAQYSIFDGVSAWAQGDGQRDIDPGEQIELRTEIMNRGLGLAHGVKLRAVSRTVGVSFVREGLELGTILPGRRKQATLVLRVLPTVKGSKVDIDVEITEARPRFSVRQSIDLPLSKQLATKTVLDATAATAGSGQGACPPAAEWTVAVLPMKDLQGGAEAGGTARFEKLTRQLQLLGTLRGLRTIDRGVQSAELERLMKEAKKETYKNCYDESCQIELGKALAASHLLVSELDRFGDQCTMGWKVMDLAQEAAVCGARVRGECSDASLLDLVESMAEQLPRIER